MAWLKFLSPTTRIVHPNCTHDAEYIYKVVHYIRCYTVQIIKVTLPHPTSHTAPFILTYIIMSQTTSTLELIIETANETGQSQGVRRELDQLEGVPHQVA
jgi:hypothetical protein